MSGNCNGCGGECGECWCEGDMRKFDFEVMATKMLITIMLMFIALLVFGPLYSTLRHAWCVNGMVIDGLSFKLAYAMCEDEQKGEK